MQAPVLPPSAAVDEYVVQGLLGRTPWATTYAAVTVPDRHVALKFFDPALTSAPGILEQLETALMQVKGLSDPFVLRPLDANQDEASGISFVAMSLCKHPSLAELVAVSPLGLDEIAALLARLGRTLDVAGPHLGLKPTNVFVGPPPEAELRIADFGIDLLRRAHLRSLPPGHKADSSWVAPEQGVDPVGEPARADVYAAGLLACFALTGKPLSNGAGGRSRLSPSQHAKAHGVSLSASAVEALQRALAPDPKHRFASVTQLAEALRRTPGARAALGAASTRHADATVRIGRFRLPNQPSEPPPEEDSPPSAPTSPPAPEAEDLRLAMSDPPPLGSNQTRRVPAFDLESAVRTARGVPKFEHPVLEPPRIRDKTQRLIPFVLPPSIARAESPVTVQRPTSGLVAGIRRNALLVAVLSALMAVVCMVTAIVVVLFARR